MKRAKRALALLLTAVTVTGVTPATVISQAEEVTDTRDWTQYSSSYFYDNLKTDAEKQFYKKMTDAAMQVMNSTDDVKDIAVSCSGLTSEQAEDIKLIWKENEAQYFFIKDGESDGNGTMHLTVLSEYQNGEKRRQAKKKFTDTIDTLLSQARKEDTLLEQEKYIHDELIKRLKYRNTGADIQQSAASSLIGTETVCAGYAAAFSVLMNALGLPAISVTSTKHEWNEVCLDGVWYNVDVMWDDPDYNQETDFRNFDVSDSTICTSYMHVTEPLWDSYGRPACLKDLAVRAQTQEFIDKSQRNPGQIITELVYDDDAYFGTNGTGNQKLYIQKACTDREGWSIEAFNGIDYLTGKDQNSAYIIDNADVGRDGYITVKTNSRKTDMAWELVKGNLQFLNFYFMGTGTYLFCDADAVKNGSETELFEGMPVRFHANGIYMNLTRYLMTGVKNPDIYAGELKLKPSTRYLLLRKSYAKEFNKQIEHGVGLKKKSLTLKKKKSIDFPIDDTYSPYGYSSIKRISYSSSDKKVAAVSSKGKIQAKKSGTAKITAKVRFMNGDTKKLKVKVKVK